MSNPPAFQLYASDFYMDTVDWDNDEIGIYFRLLMAEWVNGPLDNSIHRLAKIAKLSPKKFQKKWQKVSLKFHENGDKKLINRRLEEVREKQENYKKSQQESGKKGAERRWGKDSNPNGNLISEPNSENIALQSSSSLKEKEIKKEKEKTDHFSDKAKEFLDEINDVGKKIQDKGFGGIWQLIQEWANQEIHPGAIAEVLNQCQDTIIAGKSTNPQGLLRSQMKIRAQNWREKGSIQEHQHIKSILNKIMTGIK